MSRTPENKPKDSILKNLGITTLLVAGTYYLLSLTPYSDRYKSTPETFVPSATPAPIVVNTERAKRAWIIYTASGAYPKNHDVSPSPSPTPRPAK